ncbi:LamG-like jellyroll fold domain-containing protein [Calycomorphotria hydatis]|uniref:FecR protein n=1 Tax=Calycomorphotria hydatis TaxID=2528027 RepID=A0A517TD81_9PLAN|nr:LamG-like jellyroll fold domain-containing protein [Calycomorphotria hydatis]QDT66333.1 FecR protein [Calycomorphotria hydatis]
MDNNIQALIFKAVDGVITPDEFEVLQDAIENDPAVRDEYLRAVRLSDSLSERALDFAMNNEEPGQQQVVVEAPVRSRSRWFMFAVQAVAAIAVLALVGGFAFKFGQLNVAPPDGPVVDSEDDTLEQREPYIAGHATLRRVVDMEWTADAPRYHQGDLLPAGRLKYDAGTAEIDFFCGATLIVEGPAELDLESDWSVRVLKGRLRANVPPAARGFVVKAADAEIVDLGTEFTLDVSVDNARVEVIDGEVELRGNGHDSSRLVTGQKQWIKETETPLVSGEGPSTPIDLQRRHLDAQLERFETWKTNSHRLSSDERLIAHYPIALSPDSRVIANAASSTSMRDAQIIGPVEHKLGRFGEASAGLGFSRPGARLRTRIDGEFEAYTFTCWVRIDSLEHRYNALFMSDGYENGEPHWQIRDDGKLMFSVMVDDSQNIEFFNKEEQRVVRDAGLHRVYYTEPIWDITQSGQWLHLAAVYDPAHRVVTQYVNGEQISRQEIIDKFYINKLTIGAAEIGNWGQPFRKTPWFAVRNLNGAVDELAIFNAALTSDEIHSLYEQGKPLGY